MEYTTAENIGWQVGEEEGKVVLTLTIQPGTISIPLEPETAAIIADSLNRNAVKAAKAQG